MAPTPELPQEGFLADPLVWEAHQAALLKAAPNRAEVVSFAPGPYVPLPIHTDPVTTKGAPGVIAQAQSLLDIVRHQLSTTYVTHRGTDPIPELLVPPVNPITTTISNNPLPSSTPSPTQAISSLSRNPSLPAIRPIESPEPSSPVVPDGVALYVPASATPPAFPDESVARQLHMEPLSPVERALQCALSSGTRGFLTRVADSRADLCYHTPGTVAIAFNRRYFYPTCMRDSGSNAALISATLVEELQLPITHARTSITGFDGKTTVVDKRVTVPLALVLAPNSAYSMVQWLTDVHVVPRLERLGAHILLPTKADQHSMGYTDVARQLYIYPYQLPHGDINTLVGLPMHCTHGSAPPPVVSIHKCSAPVMCAGHLANPAAAMAPKQATKNAPRAPTSTQPSASAAPVTKEASGAASAAPVIPPARPAAAGAASEPVPATTPKGVAAARPEPAQPDAIMAEGEAELELDDPTKLGYVTFNYRDESARTPSVDVLSGYSTFYQASTAATAAAIQLTQYVFWRLYPSNRGDHAAVPRTAWDVAPVVETASLAGGGKACKEEQWLLTASMVKHIAARACDWAITKHGQVPYSAVTLKGKAGPASVFLGKENLFDTYEQLCLALELPTLESLGDPDLTSYDIEPAQLHDVYQLQLQTLAAPNCPTAVVTAASPHFPQQPQFTVAGHDYTPAQLLQLYTGTEHGRKKANSPDLMIHSSLRAAAADLYFHGVKETQWNQQQHDAAAQVLARPNKVAAPAAAAPDGMEVDGNSAAPQPPSQVAPATPTWQRTRSTVVNVLASMWKKECPETEFPKEAAWDAYQHILSTGGSLDPPALHAATLKAVKELFGVKMTAPARTALDPKPPATPSRYQVSWPKFTLLLMIMFMTTIAGPLHMSYTTQAYGPPRPCINSIRCAVATVGDYSPAGTDTVPPDVSHTKDPDGGWIWGNHPGATPDQFTKLQDMVRSKKHAFAYSMADLTGYCGDFPPFRVELKPDSRPVFDKRRQFSAAEQQILDEKMQELLDAGLIARCDNIVFAANPTVAGKKDSDGNYTAKRVAYDFRRLNEQTQHAETSLPTPEELFAKVGTCKWLSKADMRSGFSQCLVDPTDGSQQRLAVWWKGHTWYHKYLPFGVRMGPSYFQQLMSYHISKAGLDHICVAFIDDILIFSHTLDEHIQHVAAVLDMISSVGMKAHPDKSVFGCDKVEFLGHMISAFGMSPTAAKVAAIQAMPAPTNVSELRSFIGLCSYYRVYTEKFSVIAADLYCLLKKNAHWLWETAQQTAFEALKEALTTPGKALKRVDPTRPLIVHTDWSHKGMGAVLGQLDDAGNEYICACISRSLNIHEQHYAPYQGEMLAVVWAVKSFRNYLHGVQFSVYTDHAPLQWLMGCHTLSGQYARWALTLQEYDMKIHHRPGTANANADALSRLPQPSTDDVTGARLDGPPVTPHSSTALAAYLACAPVQSSISVSEHTLRAALASPCCSEVDSAPSVDDMLAGNSGCPYMDFADPLDTPVRARVSAMQSLAMQATTWVRTAFSAGHPTTEGSTPTQPHTVINSATNTTFLQHALKEGVVLLELFGGMCAGLEMCLRNGIQVTKYLYVDKDPAAQRVASHRLQLLSAQYPHLLPKSAYKDAFTSLPQDIRDITDTHLVQCGSLEGDQWLVVAGWDCSDLSVAGNQAGFNGHRSNTFFPCVDILKWLQAMQSSKPPGYLIENVCTQYNMKSEVVRKDATEVIFRNLGLPIAVDAAQFGSYAHRLRNFWTNLGSAQHLHQVIRHVVRDPHRSVVDVLDPGNIPQTVKQEDRFPYYPCNVVGELPKALPTLVAFPNSHAFTGSQPGMIFGIDGKLTAPNCEERERILGYDSACTAAPGATAHQRHQITGRCMDAHVMQSLMAICISLQRYRNTASAVSAAMLDTSCSAGRHSTTTRQGGEYVVTHGCITSEHHEALLRAGAAGTDPDSSGLEPSLLHTFNDNFVAHIAEETRENQRAGRVSWRDVWLDLSVMRFLEHGTIDPQTSGDEVKRIRRRAQGYVFRNDKIYKRLADRVEKLVPAPAARSSIIQELHETCGHFGRKRTLHLLMLSHWWSGMLSDVASVLQSCTACDQVKASFNATPPQLQPLEIAGLFYRWGVDLFGPIPESGDASKPVYVMIAIEYFSKHVEAIVIPNKYASTTANTFLNCVLSRYGACAEVVTDGGPEFQGAFHELLEKCFIDHRTTSPYHPQADGLAERAVQTIKAALRKVCTAKSSTESWAEQLPWILLGYRCSRQASTGLSPYQLMYATPPCIPPAIRDRLEDPISWDDPELAAASYLIRAEYVRRACPIAWNNLLVAQHRDTLRYNMRRGGGLDPKIRKFVVGDFVYVRGPGSKHAFMPEAKRRILRVAEVRPTGVLVLQGKCGNRITSHMTHCAPCHLPGIDPTIDPSLSMPDPHHPCEVCNYPDDSPLMILCDSCNAGYHTYCLDPPLDKVPGEGIPWQCPACLQAGIPLPPQAPPITDDHSNLPVVPAAPDDMDWSHLSADDKARRAQALHGRIVAWKVTIKGDIIGMLGKVKFIGADAPRSRWFDVELEDGTVVPSVTLTMVRNKLMPLGTDLSPAPITAAASYTSPRLPNWWNVCDPHCVQALLRGFMPGSWSSDYARWVSSAASTMNGQSISVDVSELTQHVHLRAALSILDPVCGSSSIANGLRSMGLPVVTNDPRHAVQAQYHLDYTRPECYFVLQNRAPIDFVVTRPPVATIDIVIPLLCHFSNSIVCALVPSTFVTHAPPPREQWLKNLFDHHRAFVFQSSATSGSTGFVWFVWVANRWSGRTLLHPA